MSEKTRKRLTRDKAIEITGRDDFSQRSASIQEMQKVFEEYNLQVRVYNFSHIWFINMTRLKETIILKQSTQWLRIIISMH